MPFTFERSEIPGVIVTVTKQIEDSRGFFQEVYKNSDFKKAGINGHFGQFNISVSRKNVLRGLHYQLNPNAQGKLINVIDGEIFDVAVDIRKDSPCYGKWTGLILSDKNKKMLYVPEGFLHGFCVLSDTAKIIYFCTSEYSKKFERGIIWNDPSIGINWPVKKPILSEKDEQLPLLENAENNFIFKP
ncbi:dTDP-4-dehydrorhamnose 3,5-epimerase [Candidatus Omnitrophus magneticus]|uniref:dTDP-4-dehydrorhamnose 3,5-epimerase n=1 Tax=Candidatus Omnitrophus magneticus TaxID=1609969 RepID=A0A0F0CNF5_9BACT|nr:dTDP-4-dehydrorhamnose 3,5-epimerase [Candidatus Omnitrophus magneticus]